MIWGAQIGHLNEWKKLLGLKWVYYKATDTSTEH